MAGYGQDVPATWNLYVDVTDDVDSVVQSVVIVLDRVAVVVELDS